MQVIRTEHQNIELFTAHLSKKDQDFIIFSSRDKCIHVHQTLIRIYQYRVSIVLHICQTILKSAQSSLTLFALF
jgi:hypothetical protein